MKKYLIVVDMQKDFVDGALGSAEAVRIVPAVSEKIRSFDGKLFVTYDTHHGDYMDTAEGKKLPVPHCIRGTEGWELNGAVAEALKNKAYEVVEKPTFGSTVLPELIRADAGDEDFCIELIGLCTDICVVSNALLLKAHFPEKAIAVDAACCAGVSRETHLAALTTMRCCQIDVIGTPLE